MILFRCTDKGSHTSREIYRLELSERGGGTTANERAMNRLTVSIIRDGKRGDKVWNTGDPVKGPDVPTALSFPCPTCKLDRQIKYVDLVVIIEKLEAAGVADVDVSCLPAKIVTS